MWHCGQLCITRNTHRFSKTTLTHSVGISLACVGLAGILFKLYLDYIKVGQSLLKHNTINSWACPLDHLRDLEQSLSTAILRSAWVEPDTAVRSSMWKPLLTILKRLCHPRFQTIYSHLSTFVEHPIAWELEAREIQEAEEAEEETDSEEEDDTDAPKTQSRRLLPKEQKIARSPAYDEFRQFLELGCMGSPVEAYPAILVVLSTIPPSVSVIMLVYFMYGKC